MRVKGFLLMVALLATSCGNQTSFVLRMRDSSSRPKPNNLYGTIASAEAGEKPFLIFAGSAVSEEWAEEVTTVTSDTPPKETAYRIVAWLELDGQVPRQCEGFDQPCEPTSGDAVIRAEAPAGPRVVFTLDFK